jgi:hypothetical protein
MRQTGQLVLLLLLLAGPAGGQDALPRLTGVVLTAQGGAAYLEDPATGQVRAYRVGDVIGGLQLVRIEANRVVLHRGTEVVEVPLAGVPPPPGVAPDPVVPPVPVPGDAAAGSNEAGPCPPTCAPATTILPGQPQPGQPCPPSCPAAEGPATGAGAVEGSAAGCPPNCPPPAPPPAGSPQPCPPDCPPASVTDPGRVGPAPGGARP